MFKIIIIAFLCVIGAAAALGVISLIYMACQKISNDRNSREKKAKTVLGDRDIYLKKQMFEELTYIEKYKKELEQGKWPREMEKKFEYNEPKTNEFICEITETGLLIKPKKRFLKLKDCFKKKQGDNQPKDNPKEVKKKDNDKNKQ